MASGTEERNKILAEIAELSRLQMAAQWDWSAAQFTLYLERCNRIALLRHRLATLND